MNIALVDDEQFQLNTLSQILTSALSGLGMDAEHIDRYSEPQVFLDGFEAGKYDIIILDIYMNGLMGVDVARKIREKDEDVSLAFCTSSNDFASQSYEVNARDYLQKPITEEKVARMLTRFNLARIERNRSIRLPDGFKVPLRSIIFTEYINHSVRFHIHGQTPRTVRTSQSEVEAMLSPYRGFHVINKGCIVNFEQVKAIDVGNFLMQNGENVPIARRRYKEIEAAYTKYLFDKMVKEVSD